MRPACPECWNVNVVLKIMKHPKPPQRMQNLPPCFSRGDSGGSPYSSHAGRRRGITAAAFLLLIFAQISFAQLSGSLSGTLGPGDLHVVGNIWIDSDDSLRLMPGTTFHFDGYYSFGIHGPLLAEGTETDSIVFSTDTLTNPDRWQGLRFYNSNSDGSRLSYCVVQFGWQPDYYGGGVFIHESSPSFSNCTFRSNIAENFGGGVHCAYSSSSFTNCNFLHNSCGSAGGGVYGGEGDFTDCIFAYNSSGSGGGCSGRMGISQIVYLLVIRHILGGGFIEERESSRTAPLSATRLNPLAAAYARPKVYM